MQCANVHKYLHITAPRIENVRETHNHIDRHWKSIYIASVRWSKSTSLATALSIATIRQLTSLTLQCHININTLTTLPFGNLRGANDCLIFFQSIYNLWIIWPDSIAHFLLIFFSLFTTQLSATMLYSLWNMKTRKWRNSKKYHKLESEAIFFYWTKKIEQNQKWKNKIKIKC